MIVRRSLMCTPQVPDPNGGPDLIVSGSCDRSIRFWNVQTCVCVRVLWGHDGWVWCLCLEGKVIGMNS